MSIFAFTDGKCFLYVYQAKFSLLDKIKDIISLHTIQNVVSLIYLPLSFSLTYDIKAHDQQVWPSLCDA